MEIRGPYRHFIQLKPSCKAAPAPNSELSDADAEPIGSAGVLLSSARSANHEAQRIPSVPIKLLGASRGFPASPGCRPPFTIQAQATAAAGHAGASWKWKAVAASLARISLADPKTTCLSGGGGGGHPWAHWCARAVEPSSQHPRTRFLAHHPAPLQFARRLASSESRNRNLSALLGEEPRGVSHEGPLQSPSSACKTFPHATLQSDVPSIYPTE